jgi:hypothetical protein
MLRRANARRWPGSTGDERRFEGIVVTAAAAARQGAIRSIPVAYGIDWTLSWRESGYGIDATPSWRESVTVRSIKWD